MRYYNTVDKFTLDRDDSFYKAETFWEVRAKCHDGLRIERRFSTLKEAIEYRNACLCPGLIDKNCYEILKVESTLMYTKVNK